MIIYGIHPVREAVRSPEVNVERLLVSRGKSNPRLNATIEQARQRGVPIRFEPPESLSRRAGSSHHQDVVALVSPVRPSSLEEILKTGPKLLLLLDSLEDPGNLGAVLRTAEASGVEGVLLPERRCCALTPAAVKASAGAALHMRIARIGNVAQTLRKLKDGGFWVVGLDEKGQQSAGDIDTGLPLVAVVGGESRGIRPLVRKNCDFLVSLPMKGRINSLNLSVAAGIFLFQLGERKEGVV